MELVKRPVLLDEKWPKLKKAESFASFVSYGTAAFSLIDQKSSYLLFPVSSKHKNVESTTFDVHQQAVITPSYSMGNLAEDVPSIIFLSSDEPLMFYVVQKKKNNEISMRKFRFANADISDGKSPIEKLEDRQICKGNDEKVLYFDSIDKSCQKPFTMKILFGFVRGDKFHLFALEEVLIVDKESQDQQPVEYETMDTMDYFVCKDKDDPRGHYNNQGNKDSKEVMLTIIIVALVILLFLSTTWIIYQRRKLPNSKTSSSSKRNKNVEENNDEGLEIEGLDSLVGKSGRGNSLSGARSLKSAKSSSMAKEKKSRLMKSMRKTGSKGSPGSKQKMKKSKILHKKSMAITAD